MADCIVIVNGGSGVGSDELTAQKSHVLKGYTYVGNDTNDESGTGTMVNNGAVSKTLNPGENYTIPVGYHNGSGKVTAANPMWTGWKQIYKATAQRINDGDGDLTWNDEVTLTGFSQYNTFIFHVAYGRNTSTTTPSRIYHNVAIATFKSMDKTLFELDATNGAFTWTDYSSYLNDPVGFLIEEIGTDDNNNPMINIEMVYLDDDEPHTVYGWFEIALIAAMNL